ncbi:aminoglycoside phosphotransferase family protein [Actinoplanes hulinensis]|uniref:Aminoglycoside phosphotransferase family protein n=1 Tax=Actinoplanes hulinensis TaxID=1144547 RepID=A0ABS7AY83_9ACTN|nr:aminoglycoside phosphotransferase family protein [Actinoplanes hulinensis]MBW6433720.1 aminoglycoside phosphotransferase family protein [Actinoplanes hulinensis]
MELDPKTQRWTLTRLPPGTEILAVEELRGGWSSLVRGLHTSDGDYVLRSMTRPELAERAHDMLTRETLVLRMLESAGFPAPRTLGTDLSGDQCGWPSLLMTRLPGRVEIGDDGAAGTRALALARRLAAIHRLRSPSPLPEYVPWAWPGEIKYPEHTVHAELWRRAEDLITRNPPRYPGRFLHRDFHPGNVLFDDTGALTGVIDWTESSHGPADLDVAHCATMLALLHGDALSDAFVDAYRAAGGQVATDRATHLYWRLLDALSFAPDAPNAGEAWRGLGRHDLTPDVLARALERHLGHLIRTFG